MTEYPIILRAPEGSTVRIDRFPLVLGRYSPGQTLQPDCDVTPFDPSASVGARHAQIDWREGRLYATDLGSLTGTTVNGIQAPPNQPVEIGPYGVVALGAVALQVQVEGVTVPPQAMPPPPPPPTPMPPEPMASPDRPAPSLEPSFEPDPAIPEAPPVQPPPVEPLSVPTSALEPPPQLEDEAAPWPSAEPAQPPTEPEPGFAPGTALEPGPPVPASPAPRLDVPPHEVVPFLLAALDKPEIAGIRVETGQVPVVRTGGTWEPVGDRAVDGALWAELWAGLCARTGIDPASTGYVTRLVDGAVSLEALLPPITTEPSIVTRRLAEPLSLDALVHRGLISGGLATEVRDTLRARRGVLVLGDPRSALSAVLEALVDLVPPGERVAVVEPRPQLRLRAPSALRLSSPAGLGQPAHDIALGVSPDWVVIDDALPEAAGIAAWRQGAGGPATLIAARTLDAATWRDRAAAAAAAAGAHDGGTVIAEGFGVTLTVTRDGEDGFRVGRG